MKSDNTAMLLICFDVGKRIFIRLWAFRYLGWTPVLQSESPASNPKPHDAGYSDYPKMLAYSVSSLLCMLGEACLQ